MNFVRMNKYVAYSFAITGAVLVLLSVVGIFVSKSYDGKTMATVSKIVESEEVETYGDDTVFETVYTQFITYSVEGTVYKDVEFGTCDKSTQVGDLIEIVYDTKDPTRVSTSSITVPIIVSIVGLCAIGFSVVKLKKEK